MARPPAGPLTAKDDLDLTPPEERRARRLKRLLFLAIPTAAAVAVAIYFAAPSIGGAIKAWQSRRLARQAFELIDRKQWSEANAKARDAYLLRPSEPEAWRATARLLYRTGQGTAALAWWEKVGEEHRLTLEDRRLYAETALASGETATAARQIDPLLAQREGPAPVDMLLAGNLAVRRGDGFLALDYGERALTDKRAKPNEILSAATLVLAVTRPDSPPYINAWKQIEDIARDPTNAGSLDALVFLGQRQSLAPRHPLSPDASLSFESGVRTPQQLSSPSPITGETSLSLGTGGTAAAQPPTAMGLLEIADALEKHSGARPYHQLLAIQLRARHDFALTDEYVTQAVERFGKGDDETLAALAAWLNSIGRAEKTLQLLPPDRASQRQDLYLQRINALTALDRWDELKEIFSSERFPFDPVLQHMYLANARTRLGEATAATNEWQRALEAAKTPEKLLALASYAEQNHVDDVAGKAYSEAIRLAPKNRGAHAGRLRVALTSDRTAEAEAVAAEIVKTWPDDAAARNQDDYLRLLLGASGDAAEAAERQAQVLVAQEPFNWSARATLGLARLRLGRTPEALAVFRNLRATGSEPPGALAVRAAILAVTGYEEGARSDARNLGAEQLLPEERALIAPLLVERKE